MSKQDMVQKWAGNARQAETNFLPTLAWALDQFGNKNNEPIYRMIALVQGKKVKGFNTLDGGLTQFKTPLKRVLDRALSNVTFTFKGGKCSVKVGDNGGLNADVLKELQSVLELHNNNLTVKGDVFKEMFPAPERVAKEFDAVAWADRQAKAYPGQLGLLIAALQAQQSGVKKDASGGVTKGKDTRTASDEAIAH